MRWRQLSFRAQLVVMIASVMVLGGGLLLAAQYFILSSLLSDAATVQHAQAEDSGFVSGEVDSRSDEPAIEVVRQGPTWMQSDPVVMSVLGGVQLWSGVLLVLFTAVAIFGAWLLSRRVSVRIVAVTDATNAITERDLSQRLDLPGPDDDIKELGAAIDGMVERLESAFRRQEAFIANASHEFRTPLATARTTLQVAVRQDRVPAELMPDIEDVLDANRRLEELLGALLTVARGRAGAEIPTGPVDIRELMSESLSQHGLLAREHNVTCSSALPGAPLIVEGNVPLLRSLLGNLLTNAIRHNHAGGFVAVDLAAQAGQCVVNVTNSGAVIDPGLVAELIEPFQRGARSRLRNEDGSEAGTGLGLTLVDSIVTLHHGELVIDPREEGGLCVSVSLPLCPVTAM